MKRQSVKLPPWAARQLALMMACLALDAGCNKSPASQLRTGAPAEAAAKVMELYDGNTDGKLDAKELRESPGLVAGLQRIDKNRDGVIDAQEMQARFEAQDQGANVVALVLYVKSKQAPLSGAVVTLTPEPFMGADKQVYVGTTSVGGICSLQGETVKLPGVPTGFYRVHIVHQSSGADATLGCEIAGDLPSPNRVELDIQQAATPGGLADRNGTRNRP